MALLTVADAAANLGVSAQRVRLLIAEGRMAARKLGRDWIIEPRALEAVRVRKTGRPARKGEKKVA